MQLRQDSRGYRNNNPGNIRQTDINWLGESGIDLDPAFEEFTSVEWGIRAIGKLLDTYYYRHGLTSINAMLNRYAPPTENDTAAYVAAVAQRTGIGANAPLTWPDDRLVMVEAIMHHENGYQPFNLDFIADSLTLGSDDLVLG